MYSDKIPNHYRAWVGHAVVLGGLLQLGSAFGAGCPAASFDVAGQFDPGPSPGVLAVADFNGDGNLDITTLWVTALGNGDGTFQDPIFDRAGVVGNIECLSVGDVNQDGKADLVVAATVANVPGCTVWVLLGQGDGRVKVASSNVVSSTAISIVLGDVNGDGKSDLMLANGFEADTISVLLGRGDGTFQDSKDFDYSSPGHPTFVATGDFNKDGNLDLAITDNGPATEGYSGSSVSVLLGKGDGTFQPAVGYDVGRNPGRVTVSDFNGDGNSDLAVVNLLSEDISILLGNGDGTFRSAVSYATPITPQSLAVGDFNGDGKPDLAVGGRVVSVLLGKGDGTFQSFIDYEASGAGFVVAGDFNGDGKLDLATVGRVLLGRGDGTFHVARTYVVGPKPRSIATADFDADGHADIAVANSQGGSISVLMGNGDGSFRSAVNYAAGLDHPWSILAGDFNGDGKSDLAVVAYENVSVLMGRGDGTFLPAVTSSAPAGASILAASDFNGDNKLDLAVGSLGTQQNNYNDGTLSLLLGNGNGTFQTAGSITVRFPNSIALGDFDGDGKTDLAAAIVTSYDPSEPSIANSGLLVVHGNGDGTLGGSVIYRVGQGTATAAAVVTGDLNGDHKLDLAVSTAVNPSFQNISVFAGNGHGTFQPALNSGMLGLTSPFSMALADLNGDGRLDLVSCGISVLWVVLGNGDGRFQTNLPFRLPMGGFMQGAVTGDFNGDSKPDIIVSHMDYNFVTVLLNTCDANFQGAAHTHVTSLIPAGRNGGYLSNGFDGVVLTFNKPIDTNSFNSASFSITGPVGPLAFSGPLQLSNLAYQVSFPLQTENGAYRFTLLPALRDNEGFPLDQNANQIPGEPSDAYFFTLILDTVAPRVMQDAPLGDLAGPVTNVDIRFSETIDQRTFTTADVAIFDPMGQTIPATNIEVVGLNRFRISFEAQTMPGQYVLRVGPGIQDLAGNSLDQNQNGILGEAEDDVYKGAFNLVEVDLGLSNLTPFLAPSGDFVLTFTSQNGRPYAIEVSTNLASWQTVTNFTSTAATIQFVDRDTSNATERFYRVTTQ